MSGKQYLTTPPATAGMPPGIPYIIGTAAAERFSFYGMRALLVTFMTRFLFSADGTLQAMSKEDAISSYSVFVGSAYFFPILGAIVADVWWGKYRTILWLSIVYCLGHLALALNDPRLGFLGDMRTGLFIGLGLIALGSGGIKSCVSAHVGDQFGQKNAHLLEKVFGWFYLAINLGAFLSNLVTPWLMNSGPAWVAKNFPGLAPQDELGKALLGPHLAFGLPGVLMLLATIVFWMGRHVFVHVPAQGPEKVFASLQGEGRQALLKLIPLFGFVAIFWSLYDQSGSSWVLQAENLDRRLIPGGDPQGAWGWLAEPLHVESVQAINPFLILVLVPFFSYVVYPVVGRVITLTPMRKIGAGFFLTFLSFVIIAWLQRSIDQGSQPSVYWQFLAYLIITAGEVLVSVTCLEHAYTQAPHEVKSFVMALYLLSVSVGNFLTAGINKLIKTPAIGDHLQGWNYFLFFGGLMLAATVLFSYVAPLLKTKTYVQHGDESAAHH
ncbi:MAG: POT family MFS transporter [Planctomycetaceae bacterium]